MGAAEQGQHDVVAHALSAGADVAALGKHNIAAMHVASAHGHPQVVSQLARFRANINALCSLVMSHQRPDNGKACFLDPSRLASEGQCEVNGETMTPLHMASCQGHLEV